MARNRCLVVGHPLLAANWGISRPDSESAPGRIGPWLDRCDLGTPKITGTFIANPRIHTGGGTDLPRPAGHIRIEGENGRHLVHSREGPACTFKWPGDPLRGCGATLIHDDRYPPGCVRGLTNQEV